MAKIQAYEEERDSWPRRVCVVGGGIAGVELAMGFRARFDSAHALPTSLEEHLRSERTAEHGAGGARHQQTQPHSHTPIETQPQTQVRVLVCDPAASVLPQLGYFVSRSVRKKLAGLEVQVLHGSRVASVQADR
jgi:NADH dehydrogenase FAD-containing subunit